MVKSTKLQIKNTKIKIINQLALIIEKNVKILIWGYYVHTFDGCINTNFYLKLIN